MFSLYKPMLNVRHPGWCHFWTHGHNLNIHGKGRLDDTKYQGSSHSGFRQDGPYVSLCKTYSDFFYLRIMHLLRIFFSGMQFFFQ